MTAPQNVELEAAKFLQKLIQESKDEPTKLAAKLCLILQHMKSSGKENSMPFQVISRAMETVINQHGLDIEQLKSLPHPSAGGANVGGSSSSKFTSAIENDGKPGMAGNEIAGSNTSNKPLVDHESPSSLETKSGHSQERHDLTTWDKSNQNDGKNWSTN